MGPAENGLKIVDGIDQQPIQIQPVESPNLLVSRHYALRVSSDARRKNRKTDGLSLQEDESLPFLTAVPVHDSRQYEDMPPFVDSNRLLARLGPEELDLLGNSQLLRQGLKLAADQMP